MCFNISTNQKALKQVRRKAKKTLISKYAMSRVEEERGKERKVN